MDSYDCRSAREYFGFEEDFIDDEQICDDVDQLRFSRDFDFINEFYGGSGGGDDDDGAGTCGPESFDLVACLSPPDTSSSTTGPVLNGQGMSPRVWQLIVD